MAADLLTQSLDLAAGVFADGPATKAVPVHLVRTGAAGDGLPGLGSGGQRWLAATGFSGQPRRHVLVPDGEGGLAAVMLGIGDGAAGEPCGPVETLVGLLPGQLPPGTYALAGPIAEPELAAVAWGLGAYRFRRHKSGEPGEAARLVVPSDVDAARLRSTVAGVWLGRDLINEPASTMGPAELEDAARALAGRHGAEYSTIVGEDLIARNFPLIHAVGRASTRPPRLIELNWGRQGAPAVTLVGKGICFDTGGLDIKPASGMLLMKKDMGGAAAALACAHMIMSERLDVRLRVLIAAAENAIAGNAFRPGDVIRSRAGLTVEIGNTDAEGRLVLADALALADADAPELLVSMATLTGAARVALGPELPPMFCTDDAIAATLSAAGDRVADPVWRMPFWTAYDRGLESEVADLANVADSPFAGAVVAALFLKRFVRKSPRYIHLDIFGWRPSARALGPKGGEPNAARALVEVVRGLAAERSRQPT